jgi:hypothetical protein
MIFSMATWQDLKVYKGVEVWGLFTGLILGLAWLRILAAFSTAKNQHNQNSKEFLMADLTVSVPDSAHAFAEKLGAFVGEVKKAVADGWQPGQDIPAVLSAVLVDLVPAAASFTGAAADLKSDPFGSVLALAIELKKVL